MGGSTSKVARSAGSAAARQYPKTASAEATRAVPSAKSSAGAADPASIPTAAQQGPTPHTATAPSEARNEAIDLDALDPHSEYASRLSELGPVKPYPTYSPSSTAASSAAAAQGQSPTGTQSRGSDSVSAAAGTPATKTGVFPSPAMSPAVMMLQARQRIAEEAEAEKMAAGRKGFEGRSFADVATVRKILVLRDEQGMPDREIEAALGLKAGTVGRLGRVGVVEAA